MRGSLPPRNYDRSFYSRDRVPCKPRFEQVDILGLAKKYKVTEEMIRQLIIQEVTPNDIDPLLEIMEHLCCYDSYDRSGNPSDVGSNRPSISAIATAYHIVGRDLDTIEKLVDVADYFIESEEPGKATDALIKAMRLYERYGERMFVEDLEMLENGINEVISEQQMKRKWRPSLK